MIYLAAVKWGGHPPVDVSHGTVEYLLKPHLMAKIAGRSRSSLGRLYSKFVMHYFFSSKKKFLRCSRRHGVQPLKPTKTVLDVAAVKVAVNLVNSFSVSAMEKHLSENMPDSNVTNPVAIVGNILGVSVARTEAVNAFISSRTNLQPPKNLPKLIKWVAAARKSTHVGKWPDDLTRELRIFIQDHPHVSKSKASLHFAEISIPGIAGLGVSRQQLKAKFGSVKKTLNNSKRKRAVVVDPVTEPAADIEVEPVVDLADAFRMEGNGPDAQGGGIGERGGAGRGRGGGGGGGGGGGEVGRRQRGAFTHFKIRNGRYLAAKYMPVIRGVAVYKGHFGGYNGLPPPGVYNGNNLTVGVNNAANGHIAYFAEGMGDPNVNINDVMFSANGMFHPNMVVPFILGATRTTTQNKQGYRCCLCGWKLISRANPHLMVKYTWLTPAVVPSRELPAAHYGLGLIPRFLTQAAVGLGLGVRSPPLEKFAPSPSPPCPTWGG